MARLPILVLALLSFASAALADTADLSVNVTTPPRAVTGGQFPVTVSVHNGGPDTALGARVRITPPNGRFVPLQRYPSCLSDNEGILCYLQNFAAGETRDFALTFSANTTTAPMTIAAKVLSESVDPNPANDSASTTVDVFAAADLNLTIGVYPSLEPNKESQLRFDLQNLSSTPASTATGIFTIPSELTVTSVPPNCDAVDATTYRCNLAASVTFGLYSTLFTVVPRADAQSVTITGVVDSPTVDANPSDNRATLVAPVFRVAQLQLSVSSADRTDASNIAPIRFHVANTSDVVAHDVVVDLSTGFGSQVARFTADGWSCVPREIETGLRCTIATLAAHSLSDIVVDAIFPRREMHSSLFATIAQSTSSDFHGAPNYISSEAVLYRVFDVTTTADSGAGSLRAAIENANAQCGTNETNIPCKISFAIADSLPSTGWFTIAPRSPLPVINAPDFAIESEIVDGHSRIFIDGSLAGDADGLHLNSTIAIVRGLSIGNFARNALFVERGSAQVPTPFSDQRIEHNFLGVDPTGSHAAPNGLRGVMAFHFSGSIAANVIGGNARSGIYLEQAFRTDVRDNRIGVAATDETPLPNGASGIYLGPLCNDVTVENNVIENSGDFGIAVGRRAIVRITSNRFFRTGQRAIDVGLDGPSPNEEIAPMPSITSAIFDAASGDTIIEGRGVARTYPYTETLYLYANDVAVSEGNRFLGTAIVDRNGRFTFRIHEDLRGAFITANGDVLIDFGDLSSHHATEMTEPVRVR